MFSAKRVVLTLFPKHASRRYPVAYFCSVPPKNKVEVITTPTPKSPAWETRDAGTDDAAGNVAEMARAGVLGAVETGLKLGEVAKQAVDATWDATKSTAEGVRDSVGGRDDAGYRSDGGIRPDKHGEDLRRRARGCHWKD